MNFTRASKNFFFFEKLLKNFISRLIDQNDPNSYDEFRQNGIFLIENIRRNKKIKLTPIRKKKNLDISIILNLQVPDRVVFHCENFSSAKKETYDYESFLQYYNIII